MAIRSALREDLNRMTPRLRRYARALATGGPGPSELADDIVHATLIQVMGARHLGAPGDRTIKVFATVTQLHRDVAACDRQAFSAASGRPAPSSSRRDYPLVTWPGKLSAALLSLPLEDREALLLVALEGFNYGEAARILRVPRARLLTSLTQARSALDLLLAVRPEPIHRASVAVGRGASHLKLVT